MSILLQRGCTHEEIADALDRHQSSISREIHRNSVRGSYDPKKAAHKARVRIHETRYQFSKIRMTPRLEEHIVQELKRGRSPEAVSGRLKQQKSPWVVSKTAIYDWLDSPSGQRYCRYLLSGRYRRRRRSRRKRKKELIPDRVGIQARSSLTVYDYEGDTVVSSWNTVSLVTLANPLTLYMDARRVKNLKPVTVLRAFRSMLAKVKGHSLTLDNGQENRLHTKLGVKTYFCDPYSSWQKPGIENANKLLRRFIPKGANIAEYSSAFIARVVHRYNETPRKKLSWQTPNEVMREKKLFQNKKSARGRFMQ